MKNLFDPSFWRRVVRQAVADRRVIKGGPVALRMYANARNSRLTTGFGTQQTSADAELATSLPALRARSRALVRDAGFGKRARTLVQNNIIGAGIGLEALVMNSRQELNERVNDDIETTFDEWCDAKSCHTGGVLHFADFERNIMGQVFEAGECFVRKHQRVAGESTVPLTLEIIEAERIAGEFDFPHQAVSANSKVRLGVEVDEFLRPIAYWVRRIHPGDLRFGGEEYTQFERVPADDIFHIRVVDRWPQTRGEPWMHAVARKLNDLDGYSEAEIIAARGAASYMATIESPEDMDEADAEEQADGSFEMQIEPGIVERLRPGEQMKFNNPGRPNSAGVPFMQALLQEVAAGIGVSYESLSRNYANSNYSSSRLALLDDRDLWKVMQSWFVRTFREPLHELWLQQAVLSRSLKTISVAEYAINPEKFEAARFKCRGWSWVDPTKEVTAYQLAVRCGFMTVEDVISQTGGGVDAEDVFNARRKELDAMEALDLVFDTDPAQVTAKGASQPADPATTAPGDAGGMSSDGMPEETGAAPAPPGRITDLGAFRSKGQA